jgi:acetylornithine deacetylase/succinyl-diaminopimelate desuccinylase-like protein
MSLDRIIEILSALVAFDTTSRNSNLAIIDWIERHLDGLGFESERIYDATGRKGRTSMRRSAQRRCRVIYSPAIPTWCPWMGRFGRAIPSR